MTPEECFTRRYLSHDGGVGLTAREHYVAIVERYGVAVPDVHEEMDDVFRAAEAAEASAFKRGQEAMRERAAKIIDEAWDHIGEDISPLADRIRALKVDE